DFANGNFLDCGGGHYQPQPEPVVQVNKEVQKSILVSPNPVKNKEVRVYFNNIQQGKSTIEIAEVGGKRLATTEVIVSAKGQYQTIQLPATTTRGIYVVRVLNSDKSVYSQKVMVE